MNSFLRLFLCIFLVGFNAICFSQSYRFKGKIIDSDSKEVIPFAHCRLLDGSNSGFVGDFKGEFDYLSESSRIEIQVSSIGYTTRILVIDSKDDLLIELKRDMLSLAEVEITFIDKELMLLQKVLDNIENNYPDYDERLYCTVVEQLAKDSLYKDVFYTAKANVEVDKLEYSNKHLFGNVNVLDGEVELSDTIYSNLFRIAAGVHNVHRFDVLARRMEPFDKINSQWNSYKIIDTSAYNGLPLFEMEFTTQYYTGRFYIQDSTYALVRAVYSVNELGLRTDVLATTGLRNNRIFLDFVSEYYKHDSLFRLSYINYQTGFKRKARPKQEAYLNNFYYLNKYEKSESLIPYSETSDFEARLFDELCPDDSIVNQKFSDKTTSEAYKVENKISKFFNRFSASYSVACVRLNPSQSKISVDAIGLDESLGYNDKIMINIMFGYEITKRFEVEYLSGSYLFKKGLRSNSLQMVFNQPLNKSRRLIMTLTGGINYLKYDLSEDGLSIGHPYENGSVAFDVGAIDLVEHSRQFNLLSGLRLRYRVSNRLHALAYGNVPLNLFEKHFITVKQDGQLKDFNLETRKFTFDNLYYQVGIGIQLRM